MTEINNFLSLTLSWWRLLSDRNQSIDLHCKSMDWFLYDNNLCHERVNSDPSVLSPFTCFAQEIWYILMFHCLYYSGMFNESKEKFRIVFCCFSIIKKIFAQIYSSYFPIKLICGGIIVFVCLNKSIAMSL